MFEYVLSNDIYSFTHFLSNTVTVLGLPFGIFLFWTQRAKERENEDRAIYESLTASYDDFLRLAVTNTDLQLWTKTASVDLNEEQAERLTVLFELLVSVFERAYILSYSHKMTSGQERRWAAWENYMRQWCRREDFRSRLPPLLRGDDAEFVAYITNLAAEACAA